MFLRIRINLDYNNSSDPNKNTSLSIMRIPHHTLHGLLITLNVILRQLYCGLKYLCNCTFFRSSIGVSTSSFSHSDRSLQQWETNNNVFHIATMRIQHSRVSLCNNEKQKSRVSLCYTYCYVTSLTRP